MTEIAPVVTLANGRYKLEHRLGAGGMASVWVAHDTRLHRRTAVKLLSDVLACDPDYVRRFRREARVVAGLSHPNLVGVYDFGHDPRPFLIMELIDGGNLGELVNERGGEPIDAEAIARDLLAALTYIHGAGVVHRDVKPANVLIDRQGRFRLTDFGIAQPHDGARLTQTGNVIGTLRYLAPEIIRGEPASARSDLYALGILLRDCLGEQLPARLAALVDDLAQEDPQRRPQSAADALAVLDDRGTAPSETTRPTEEVLAPTAHQPVDDVTARQHGDERREHQLHIGPRTALLGIAALIALVVLIATTAGGGSQSEPRPPRASPAPADAPLERQLDALERAVRDARGG